MRHERASGWTKKALAAMAILAIAATGLVALTPGSSDAWGGGRVFIGVGPYWGWGYPGPYYFGYPYGYPYRYPPVTVVEQPRVYVQQPPPAPGAPPPPASAEAPRPDEPAYWYYCPNSRDYYPSVPACSEPWVRVPARAR